MMDGFGIVTLVQCRSGSRRMKGKALKPLAGRPMIEHVLERAAAIGFPVVLATSNSKGDDRLAKLGKKCGVGVFRGDEVDVLGRMSEAARAARARIVIRITGACPLLAPDVALEVLAQYMQCGPGTISTNDTHTSGWPDGMDVEVFPAWNLHEAAERAETKEDREHVTPWMREHLEHSILPGPNGKALGVKLSIDSPPDYERVAGVFEHLAKGELGWEATFAAVRKMQAEPKKKAAAK